MADSHKDIIITPNRNQAAQPQISFTGFGNDPITIKVLDDTTGALSFEGSAGQLFSITNNLTSGSIFAVNDVSGIPSIDVNATGVVSLAPYNGTVGIGTTNPSEEVHLYKSQNEGTVFRIDNPNTGTSANSSIRLSTDTATLSSFAHASTRTISRYGVTVGGYSEISAMAGNGLLIGTQTSSPVVLGANNTERIRITDSLVTVTGNMTVTGTLDIGAVNISGIQQGDSSISITDTGTNGRIDFKTENTSRLFINETGNIGIGTTNPTNKISIVGTSHNLNVDTVNRDIEIPNYKVNPGWDLSTATFSGKTPKPLTPETAPNDITFKPDGTKMYVIGTTLDGVSEYNLSTPWDTTTAEYYQTFITTQEAAPRGVYFVPDGFTMYIVGDRHLLLKYSLAIAWDVSTATFESQGIQTFSVVSQEGDASGIFFKPDGTQMFVIGSSTDDIFTYNLSTAWDINTAVVLRSTDFSAQDGSPSALYFKSDGTKLYILGAGTDDVYQYNLSTPWDTSTRTLEFNYAISVLNTSPSGLYFSPDGTRMFVLNQTTRFVEHYTLSTAWNISTASFTKRRAIGVDTNLQDLHFNSDGTRMFVTGITSDNVYEYTLTTAWDIATAMYTNKFFIGFESPTPLGLYFSPDGKYLFTVENTNERAFRYTLSTAWNLSSIQTSYFDLFLTAPFPRAAVFRPDGKKFYTLSSTKGRVVEYNVGTPWDVNTISYVGFYSIIAQEITPEGLKFSPDGSKMYVIGSNLDSVFEYTLSTEWSITSATYTSTISIQGQETAPTDLTFKSDGSVMYIIGTTGDDVTEYNLTTSSIVFDGALECNSDVEINSSLVVTEKITTYGNIETNKITASKIHLSQNLNASGVIINNSWNIEDATIDAKFGPTAFPNFSIADKETAVQAIYLKSDGTKYYILGSASDSIHEYDLTTAYDITTSVFVQSFSVSTQTLSPTGFTFKSDGTVLYVMANDAGNAGVFTYELSTAWNISTASYTPTSRTSQIKDISAEETVPTGIYVRSDGLRAYVVGQAGDDVTQYNLTVAWDFSTATAVSTYSVVAQSINPTGLSFSDDGTAMYVTDVSSLCVFQYVLSTAWDITTASFNQGSLKTYTIAQSAANDEIYFTADGLKMYVLGNTANTVYQYTLSTAWEVDTATYDNKSFAYGGFLTGASGFDFKTDGTKLYIVSLNTDAVFEFNLSTAWDVSTATFTPTFKEGTFTANCTNLTDFYISPDGLSLYLANDAEGSSSILQYSLSTAWDISTSSYVRAFSVPAGETELRAVTFKPDGTKMYTIDFTTDNLTEYNLSTAWNISTATSVSTLNLATRDATMQGISFSNDGTLMFVVGSGGDSVYRYSLSTAWSISTAIFEFSTLVSGQDTSPTGVIFNSAGNTMYIVGSQQTRVFQYSIAPAWDIQSASLAESSPFFNYPVGGGLSGAFLSSDGTKLYLSSGTERKIYQFDLTIPESVNSVVLGNWFDMVPVDSVPESIQFKSDGLTAFITGRSLYHEFSLSTAWSISTMSFVRSYTYGTSFTTVRSAFINSAGNRLFAVDSNLDKIYQWNLTTAWNIGGTVTLQSIPFYIGRFNGSVTGLYLSADGTRIYFQAGNTIWQHTLGTANTLSTVQIGKVLQLADREGSPQGITFGGATAGTRLYVTGASDDAIDQYNLTTAWDVSTAAYSTTASVASTVPVGVAFSTDGTKMFVAESTGDRIIQYTLTTAWAINTRNTATIVRWNTNPICTEIQDIVIRPDGKDFIVVDNGLNNIVKFTIPTAWDLNSAKNTKFYDMLEWPVSSTSWTITDIMFNNNGTKVYFSVYGSSNSRVYEYDVPTAWDLNSIPNVAAAVSSVNIYSYDRNIQQACFNDDGTKLYMIGSYLDRICKYDLTTAYSIATATNFDYLSVTLDEPAPTGIAYGNGKLFITGQTSRRVIELDMNGTNELYGIDRGDNVIHIQRYNYLPTGIFFNSDGTRFYTIGADDRINQYALSTGWDISTMTYVTDAALNDTVPTAPFFKYDGTKLFVVGLTGDSIYEYSLATPWDISTLNLTSTTSVANTALNPYGLYIDKTGTHVYIPGSASAVVSQYKMTTPWSASTLTFVRSIYIGNQDSTPYSVFFKSDGLKMYVLGATRNVLEYRLTIPWDISTAYLNKLKLVGSEVGDTLPLGLFFDNIGTKMFIGGYNNGQIYKYDLLPRSRTLSIDGTTYINGHGQVSGDLTVHGDTAIRGKLSVYDVVYTGNFLANRALKVNIDGTEMYLLLSTV